MKETELKMYDSATRCERLVHHDLGTHHF